MRAALAIICLAVTTALFQSRSWGWNLSPAWVAALSLLALSGALVTNSTLIASWRRSRGKPRLRAFLLNGLAVLAALSIWLNYVLAEFGARQASPGQRWLLALALSWMLAPFAALALTTLGTRLTRRRGPDLLLLR